MEFLFGLSPLSSPTDEVDTLNLMIAKKRVLKIVYLARFRASVHIS